MEAVSEIYKFVVVYSLYPYWFLPFLFNNTPREVMVLQKTQARQQ